MVLSFSYPLNPMLMQYIYINICLLHISASPANDELEFIKIHSRMSPKPNSTNTQNNFDNLAFESDGYNTDNSSMRHAYRPSSRPLEQPPSYATTMHGTSVEETRAANMYYADRHSVRSKASTRSKRSTSYHRNGTHSSTGRSRNRDESARRDLPWVQITPSPSATSEMQFRHFP